jgi:DNA-binding CsgD family transcriptional regulator
MADRPQLSEKTFRILKMISRGHGYDQILAADPVLTYKDIFRTAQEALMALSSPEMSLVERRQRHVRDGQEWSPGEDERLRLLVARGETVARIAGQLQRNRGAIRSRILRLRLVDILAPAVRERFERSLHRDEAHGRPSEREDEFQ